MRPHISLDVRDVGKSVAFYGQGFEVPPKSRQPTTHNST